MFSGVVSRGQAGGPQPADAAARLEGDEMSTAVIGEMFAATGIRAVGPDAASPTFSAIVPPS